MAFNVQNDTGTTTDANAYTTVQFFKDYHTERGVEEVVGGEYADSEIESGIIQATDYIDHCRRYLGARLTEDQPTEFPRQYLYHRRTGLLVEGIPLEVKRACAEYALRVLRSTGKTLQPDPTVDPSGRAIAELTTKVGPIEKTTRYNETRDAKLTQSYPAADKLLSAFSLGSAGVYR